MIKTIVEAEQYFSQFIETSFLTTGKDVTVKRMWPLLEKVDNPQNKLRAIHLAGTSGKTSTAYFVASLLKESGSVVGLTVSPHISSITERLQVDGNPVEDDLFCSLLNDFIVQIGDDIDASYFELLIVFILWSFVKLGVDYAVVETGLGGLYDATNVFEDTEKVCIITDIGIDHQHVLGETIVEIAKQKAGIIKLKNNVFMNNQSDEIMDIFKAKTQEVGGQLYVIDTGYIDGVLPNFQKRNWQLAKAVYDFVSARDGLSLLNKQQLSNSQVSVIGRMQKVHVNDQLFILDGAHNVQKMTALVSSFQLMYPNIKVPVLLAMKKDKDYKKTVSILAPIVSRIYCCGFEARQDMYVESVDPDSLVSACKIAGIEEVVKMPDVKSTLDEVMKISAPVNLVTGSFYILGNAIKILEMYTTSDLDSRKGNK